MQKDINAWRNPKYMHEINGRNSRLDSLQALVLNEKLKNYQNGIKLEKILLVYIESY